MATRRTLRNTWSEALGSAPACHARALTMRMLFILTLVASACADAVRFDMMLTLDPLAGAVSFGAQLACDSYASGEFQLGSDCLWAMYEFSTPGNIGHMHNLSATIVNGSTGPRVMPLVKLISGGECDVKDARLYHVYKIICMPSKSSMKHYEMDLFLKPVPHEATLRPSAEATRAASAKQFDVAMALSNGNPVTGFVSSSACMHADDVSWYNYGTRCTAASFGFTGVDPLAPEPWPKYFNVSVGAESGALVVNSTDPCTLTFNSAPAFMYQCNVYQIGLLYLPDAAHAARPRTSTRKGVKFAKGSLELSE